MDVKMDKFERDIVQLRTSIYAVKELDFHDKLRSPLKMNNHSYVDLDPEVFPKVHIFKRTLITSGVRAALKTTQFDMWKHEPNKLAVFLEDMYYELGLVTAINIDGKNLKNFLKAVQDNYRDNPFHNFRHCFSVAQMMYVMINELKLEKILTKLEICILLTAAICHDLDHPGLTNNYQINSHSDLAVRYENQSPLENHHFAVSLEILDHNECNIFKNASPEEFKHIHQEMRDLILSTDMTQHKDILEIFQAKLETFDFSSEDDLLILKKILIKACDISNEIRPICLAEPWVDCLLTEYFSQFALETEQGLPTVRMMDPSTTTKEISQSGFIRHILLPLYESLKKLFPQIEELALVSLRRALAYYETKHEERTKMTSSSVGSQA